MTVHRFEGYDLLPQDVTSWLKSRGWQLSGSLSNVAERWQRESSQIVVPTLRSSPDFPLRWKEMLLRLSEATATDQAGILLALSKAGSDIAEFRASGQIDDSLPLGDASMLIDSVRRALQAAANSALQPRSYYGHSIPDAARDHARNVRMGQTRRGSYIVPVISRVPILEADDAEDAVLFDDNAYQPFARTAMLRLSEGLSTLRELTHGGSAPSRSQITEAVGAGVSSELCDSITNTLETDSIRQLVVSFSWADRLPVTRPTEKVELEEGAVPLLQEVGNYLRGEPITGRQTFVGYVKRLVRGEEDEIGQITLRAIDNDKARNITMDLNDEDYHVASEANAERRMVSATGTLRREPSKALRFTEVTGFSLVEGLPLSPE